MQRQKMNNVPNKTTHSRSRRKVSKKKPKKGLKWPFSWLLTLLFLPFFLLLGMLALHHWPEQKIPPTYHALLPVEQINRLEEEMEARQKLIAIETEKIRQTELRQKAAAERRQAIDERLRARGPGSIVSPDEMQQFRAEWAEMPRNILDDRNPTAHIIARSTAQVQQQTTRFNLDRMRSKARTEWHKILAEVTVKRAGMTLGFIATCLVPALVFLIFARSSFLWPMLRGFVLAAPVLSLLALMPWLPFERPYFEHPAIVQITDFFIPLMADMKTFFITGFWP